MRRDAIRIAKKLGIRLSRRDAKKSFSWDGNSIATKNLSTSALWHEIAHWLVSTPEKRKLINFGLGNDNESFLPVPKNNCINVDGQHEEELASILGIAYEAFFGECFFTTLELHHWIEREIYNHRTKSGNITTRSWKKRSYKSTYKYTNGTSLWKIIAELNQVGLMKHHQPVYGV